MLWAVPVIFVTAILAQVLLALVPVTPVSPLPPTGTTVGFIVSFVAGVAGRAVRRGDPVPRVRHDRLGARAWAPGERSSSGRCSSPSRTSSRSAGSTAGDAFALAAVAFAARIPIAFALGWLFLRRGSVWASFGLHAAFNGILLVLAEAYRPALSADGPVQTAGERPGEPPMSARP